MLLEVCMSSSKLRRRTDVALSGVTIPKIVAMTKNQYVFIDRIKTYGTLVC
jgi:hypothetical protein